MTRPMTEAEREFIDAALSMGDHSDRRQVQSVTALRQRVARERLDATCPGWEAEAKQAMANHCRAESAWRNWESRLNAAGVFVDVVKWYEELEAEGRI